MNHRSLQLAAALALALSGGLVVAQTAVDEESPWPRIRQTNGHTVTLHLPQVESWTSNSFAARAAVALKLAGAKAESLGVIWINAHGSVDRSNRVVTLDRLEITKARFPDAPNNESNALAAVRSVIPSGPLTVSLDYLVASLGFAQAAARQGPSGLKHAPPEIIWVTNRTVLVIIDGEPVLRPIPDTELQRVINTPALLVFDRAGGRFYLNGDGRWFVGLSIQGAWSLAQSPPDSVTALATNSGGAPPPENEMIPRVVVRTHPAELVMTGGLPDFRPIRGTALQYAADTDSQLFFHKGEREAYLLMSGRWFKTKSLAGPWTHVSPRELPADFAKIPPGSPQAVVLASVPDTRQAELAVLANSVPTTATVNRRDATIDLKYDGEPKFKPIEGTSMSYAINAQLPVIMTSGVYYALDNGVWFMANAPTGPWSVAAEVPEEIYTIPPNSPVYYATFARVYQSTDDTVEVGYTPGYTGAYEDDGTVVYGTGWDYEPWYGDDYYGWGWTWGYSYVYVPWYQWWIWRNWWDQPGSLRSAVIENVYDRWQGRNGVTHYNGPADGIFRPSTVYQPGTPFQPGNPSQPGAPFQPGTPSQPGAPFQPGSPFLPGASSFSGYPALYGRFRGATRPVALSPPANTIALNPYTRPSAPVRQGEVPHGAQLLSTVHQSPGAGRDLYASPDGGVYLRKTDGWYRRDTKGQWKFAAPVKATVERRQDATTARGGQGAGANGYRLAQGGGGQGRPGRVPDAGFEARGSEIAALEREYYARALSQYRAQNWRGSGNYNRGRVAVRGGRRR